MLSYHKNFLIEEGLLNSSIIGLEVLLCFFKSILKKGFKKIIFTP